MNHTCLRRKFIKFCKMDGLFYYEDADCETFLSFYRDGRVVSFNRYNRLAQHLHSFPGLSLESENVHCFRGIYQVDIWDNIRIVIKGDFGKTEYRGFITDDDTLYLFCRNPFTWAKKSATFVRYNEQKDTSHMGLGDVCSS